MAPTPRLLLLLLLAAPLGALGGVASTAAVLLVVVALLAALADFLLARGGDRLICHREMDEVLSLGAWNPIRLRVEGHGVGAVKGEVRDTPPPPFRLTLQPEESSPLAAPLLPFRFLPGSAARDRGGTTTSENGGDLEGGGTALLTYHVWPPHRGDYHFGDLYLQVLGPLELVKRRRRLGGTAQSVRVYPNLRDIRRYELMARRGAVADAGSRRVRAPGATTEFERLREYLPDDEFRRINWKATARRGKAIVNEYEAERSQNLVLMIDSGRLMAARADAPVEGGEATAITASETSAGLTKLDHALNSALLLAYVGSVRGDRVALMTYADEVRTFLPPARGRRVFISMVQALYNVHSEPVEPDHGLAFQFLAGRSLRRSLVVLFTDVIDRESSSRLVANLLQAARHHQVVCVTLGDPNITRPALAIPNGSQGLYEKMVAQKLLDERAQVLATLSQRGVMTLDTDADKLSPRLIASYLELKERGRI